MLKKNGIRSAVFLMLLPCLLFAAKLTNDYCVNESDKVKVLIAMQNGQFKDSVMTVVKAALENDAYCVKIIELKRLGDEIVENYRAVIIVNTCHGGSINGGVAKYLKKLSSRDKKKIVLVTTTGGDGWQPKGAEVDCVTSASKLNKALSVADTITAKTRAALSRKN